MKGKQDVEHYWSIVGEQIRKRGGSHVAGDDDPYLRYKRAKFLTKFLDTMEIRDRTVLEVGFGPGGNLNRLAERGMCMKILGADISQEMLQLASRNLRSHGDAVELHKIDGTRLPFADRSVDLSFTVTVLQHNTDEQMVRTLVSDICRVTRTEVVLMEDIGDGQAVDKDATWTGRRMGFYQSLLSEFGFRLLDAQFLNTALSRWWHDLVFNRVYRRFIRSNHREGEDLGVVFKSLIGAPLFLTRHLDERVGDSRDLAKMVFRRG